MIVVSLEVLVQLQYRTAPAPQRATDSTGFIWAVAVVGVGGRGTVCSPSGEGCAACPSTHSVRRSLHAGSQPHSPHSKASSHPCAGQAERRERARIRPKAGTEATLSQRYIWSSLLSAISCTVEPGTVPSGSSRSEARSVASTAMEAFPLL